MEMDPGEAVGTATECSLWLHPGCHFRH